MRKDGLCETGVPRLCKTMLSQTARHDSRSAQGSVVQNRVDKSAPSLAKYDTVKIDSTTCHCVLPMVPALHVQKASSSTVTACRPELAIHFISRLNDLVLTVSRTLHPTPKQTRQAFQAPRRFAALLHRFLGLRIERLDQKWQSDLPP